MALDLRPVVYELMARVSAFFINNPLCTAWLCPLMLKY